MDTKKALVILGAFGLLALSVFVHAQPIAEIYDLTEGKNTVVFHEPSFARDILAQYNEIQAISYTDVLDNTTVGYVRAFGGLGKNFLIVPGEPYEIVVDRNVTLAL